jgi:regulator of protease activity HflC (stomatin/prohibitin superfamily)
MIVLFRTFNQNQNMEPIIIVISVVIVLMALSLFTVKQGTIAVITMFGKYKRALPPGLRFKIPFIEQVTKRISIQNQSIEMEFQAVTIDQANVYFKSMLLYSVMDAEEETIKKHLEYFNKLYQSI